MKSRHSDEVTSEAMADQPENHRKHSKKSNHVLRPKHEIPPKPETTEHIRKHSNTFETTENIETPQSADCDFTNFEDSEHTTVTLQKCFTQVKNG